MFGFVLLLWRRTSRLEQALRAMQPPCDPSPSWLQVLGSLPPFRWLPGIDRLRQSGEGARKRKIREHPVSFAVGRGLIQYVDVRHDHNVMDQFAWLRREMHRDLGVLLPGVLVHDNFPLEPFDYVLFIEGKEVARGKAFPGRNFVLLEKLDEVDACWQAVHPITQQKGLWIGPDQIPDAMEKGALFFGPLQLITMHLRHILWQKASEFVSTDYTIAVLKRICELEEPHPSRVVNFERYQPHIKKVFRQVLEQGGDLRDVGHVVRVFESSLPRFESPEIIARKAMETTNQTGKNYLDASVAGALLYSAHWNEMLCLELFPNMDVQQLGQLTAGIIKMQHYSGAAVEMLWNELGGRSESLVFGRSNQELAEHIRGFLQRGSERTSKLARLEKLAILVLSLPKESGPNFVSDFMSNFSRHEAGELAALVGRLAPFWSETPMRADGRFLAEIGLRERVVREFLDWRLHQTAGHGHYVRYCLSEVRDVLAAKFNANPQVFCSLIQRRYFGITNPLGRFREMSTWEPKTTMRLMLAYAQSDTPPASAETHVAGVIKYLPSEISQSVLAELKRRGHRIEVDPRSVDSLVALNSMNLLLHYFQSHEPSMRDSTRLRK